jgi:hypothetical protein
VSDTQPCWCGWWRPPGGSWRKLAGGATEVAAWAALLDAAERGRLNGGLAVLLAGQVP